MKKEEIYRGESLTLVLRCHDRDGNPQDMTRRRVMVVMTDRMGRTVLEFSTGKDSPHRLSVDGHILMCDVPHEDMAALHGVYLTEVRVEEDITTLVPAGGEKKIQPRLWSDDDDGNGEGSFIPFPGGPAVTPGDGNGEMQEIVEKTIVQIDQIPGTGILDSVTGKTFRG